MDKITPEKIISITIIGVDTDGKRMQKIMRFLINDVLQNATGLRQRDAAFGFPVYRRKLIVYEK